MISGLGSTLDLKAWAWRRRGSLADLALYAGRDEHMGLGIERLKHIVSRVGVAADVLLTILAIAGVASRVDAGSPQGGAPSPDTVGTAKGAAPSKKTPVKLGLVINDPAAFQGYTLINTLNAKSAYLIDMQGRVVHSWRVDC